MYAAQSQNLSGQNVKKNYRGEFSVIHPSEHKWDQKQMAKPWQRGQDFLKLTRCHAKQNQFINQLSSFEKKITLVFTYPIIPKGIMC